MRTIRFTDEADKVKLEAGHRIIMLNGSVEYTEHKWVYRVPNYILRLLDKEQIPYEVLKSNG